MNDDPKMKLAEWYVYNACVTAELRGETSKAFKLRDGTKTEWVPKSLVENNQDGTFTMPEWLAKEKGFV